ncbi:MAG: TonB-dependent receptor [Sphingobacteriales bacterium]|nr:MAG: TonB-dependent receptor [Sphingobacteriales bacterium]
MKNFYSKKFKYLLFMLFSLALNTSLLAQTAISGKLSDENGEPLPGVSVKVKGSKGGGFTDADGVYNISAPSNGTLIFTYIGFDKAEISIEGKTNIDFVLKSTTAALDEVVVVGYGSQRKKDVTGSAVSVKTKDLNTTNAVSIDNLLQGRVAGLNVNTYTSQPGGGISINIRGSISPLGGSNPLYVIDGVQITNNASTDFTASSANTGMRGFVDRNPLNNINPNDIETVTVLKDASATAIYGSAAANGVILITTKRGKAGKVSVSYNATESVQNMAPYIKVFNAQEFMQQANLWRDENRLYTNGFAPYYGTKVDDGSIPQNAKVFSETDIANAGMGTNYIDQITRRGRISDHNISLSGGNENTKVFSSFNIFDQKAMLANSSLTRIIGRVNLDQRIGSAINFKLGLSYSQINNNNVSTGNQTGNDRNSPSLLRDAMAFAPSIQPFNDRGELNLTYDTKVNNPLGYFMITDKSQNKRLFINPSLEVKITDELRATIVGGIDQTSTTSDFFIPRKSRFWNAPTGNGQIGYQARNNYSMEGFLNFDKNLLKNSHRITVVLGGGYYTATGNDFALDGVNFATDVFGTANMALAANKDLNRLSSNKIVPPVKLSQFTRLNYSINDKYLFNASARFDASNKFGTNNQVGFFPGASFAWKIHNEKFMKGTNNTISELKFRTSYGTSGNDNITGNQTLSLYGPGYSTAPWNFLFGNQIATGILQTQQGNQSITWETNITFNAGIDFGLFKDRITGSVEYFNRTAKNLLDFANLNSNSAIQRIGTNVGSTRSTGIEIALNTKNILTKNFSWNTNLTLGTFKATWVSRNPDNQLSPWIKENDPMQSVYGWKTNGIIRTQTELDAIKSLQPNAVIGNLRYIDVNGDGKMNKDDIVNLGDFNPKGTFGINNTFAFKNIDLSFFIYGNYGGLSWDGWRDFTRGFDFGTVTPSNASVYSADIFTSFNTNGKYPSIANDLTAANNSAGANDYTMKKTYFARLKNITLGYTLPNKILGKKKILQSARLFVDVANLGVITNYVGLDPEMERNNGPYPIARTIAFGFNTRF